LKSGKLSEYFQGLEYKSDTNKFATIGSPVDELDLLCKKWVSDRRCINLFNGVCHGNGDRSYPINLLSNSSESEISQPDSSLCENSTESCESTRCFLDQYYVKLIKNKFNDENREIGTLDCTIRENNAISSSINYHTYCEGDFNQTTGTSELAIIHNSVDESFGVPIMKIAADDLFQYESPYWENDELLNVDSAWEDAEVNSKYQTFLNVEFNTLKVCLDQAYNNCYTNDRTEITTYSGKPSFFISIL